jgi:hypothetical protein
MDQVEERPPDPPGSRDRLANLCCGHAACQRETERVATAAYADGYAAGRKDAIREVSDR